MPDRARQHRHAHAADPLEADITALELQAGQHALVEDAAAGLVPPWARRGLHPHELAARVSFAALDAQQQAVAAVLGRRLQDDRQAFLELLLADLATLPGSPAVVERLIGLEVAGLATLRGAPELLQAGTVAHLEALQQAAHVAAAGVLSEAAQQGVGLPALELDAAAQVQLRQIAQRLAVAPQVDLVRFLRDEAIRLPNGPTAGVVESLQAHAAGLSTGPLDERARTAAAETDGLGRQSALATAPVAPAKIYASELLDGNTCGPCSFVDGTEYPSLAAARLDYPAGNYVRCEGGERCRGTLVAVWDTETPVRP